MTSNNPFPMGHKINLGRVYSKECIQKRIETRRKNGWWKHPEETKRKIGTAHKGNKWGVGHKVSEVMKNKLREQRAGNKGSNWKGGVTTLNKIERLRFKSTMQKKVFERDGFKCVLCGNSKKLQVDHILSWAKFPKQRFDIDNCRTLCLGCHYKITYGREMPKEKHKWGCGLALCNL